MASVNPREKLPVRIAWRIDRQGRPGAYVSECPGEGGADWGYVFKVDDARPLNDYWQRRFRRDMERLGMDAGFAQIVEDHVTKSNPLPTRHMDFSDAMLHDITLSQTRFVDDETIQVELVLHTPYAQPTRGLCVRLTDPLLADFIGKLFARAADHLRRLNA